MHVTLHITEHMLHIHILATTQRVKFLDKGVSNSVVESSGGPLTSVRRCSSAPGSCGVFRVLGLWFGLGTAAIL